MSTHPELIHQLRRAVPVATRAECQRALQDADGDLDRALELLGPVKAEAEADRRDRLETLARERQFTQLRTLAQQGNEADSDWFNDLLKTAVRGAIDEILAGQLKTEPMACYRLTGELADLADLSALESLDPISARRLEESRRRAATQLLMATVVDHGSNGESPGRASFQGEDELVQVRIFPPEGDDHPDPLELARSGADPNSMYGKNTGSYNEGKSVLMRVIENMGDETLARELLKQGADPLFACGVNRQGAPAHNYTVLRSCYITVSEEVGAGTYATSTDEVRSRRAKVPMMSLEFVQELLNKGVDPNIQNHRGGPLHYAASLDLPDHVLLLLQAGADPQQSFLTGGQGEMT
ncbi:MAG: hypothetical protein VX938_00950, partial [Myxococcota bacterium]|nr:hypothetical protein [Myxococcota bacterium]